MELINLKPEEARHVVLWLSPDGKKIYSLSLTAEEIATSLFEQLSNSRTTNLNFLDTIAEMICLKNSITLSSSARDYLLDQGWIYYCQIQGRWIWYGRKLNIYQSTIARQIDNNVSLQLLIDKLK